MDSTPDVRHGESRMQLLGAKTVFFDIAYEIVRASSQDEDPSSAEQVHSIRTLDGSKMPEGTYQLVAFPADLFILTSERWQTRRVKQ